VNFNLSNKNSYSHASHHGGVEATRRSDTNYQQNLKQMQGASQGTSGGGPANTKNNSSQQNMMMIKSNNSGSNFMNLGGGGDPLHQSKKGGVAAQSNQYGHPNLIQNIASPSMNTNYYVSSGANSGNQNGTGVARKNSKNSKNQDYNYNINLEKYGGSGGNSNQPGSSNNNPLLASVHTQGSLKGNEARTGGQAGKGSGVSQGSHGGSAINISKKDGTKSGGAQTQVPLNENLGPPGQAAHTSGQRVGSINSNPGSQASRGSKYNIHQQNPNQQALHNLQNSNSPPSVRNKIQMHKIMKNSNTKNNGLNTKKS
jgi:hypothetical protein